MEKSGTNKKGIKSANSESVERNARERERGGREGGKSVEKRERKEESRGPAEREHVTGVVNISLAFVLRRPTDVPGFIYALRYTPVQPLLGFLLLTRRSYP